MEKREIDTAGQNPHKSPNDNDYTDPNVVEGKKAIEIEKQNLDLSEEEAAKDASDWRNEG